MNFILWPHSSLKELATNLPGIYFLYPSASYGSWLRVAPAASPFNSQQGLLSYVSQLGGNAILLGQALSVHAATLDSPYVPGPSGPKFEVIVGTGRVTATSIEILSGGRIGVFYGDGDGTVPSKSAARGALDNSNPNHSHIHYACGVDHVDLPGDRQITDAIGDYLKYGDDIKPMGGACSISGASWEPYDLAALPATTDGSGFVPADTPSGTMSLEDAVLQGVVDYTDLPNQKIAVTNGDFAPVALPAAKFLVVTPISDEGKGQPVVYGPLNGQITISRTPVNALFL